MTDTTEGVMGPARTFALFYEYHPTGEYLMLTAHADNLADGVFEGRRTLREIVGKEYQPENFTLAKSFPVR
jgi:hypothetical protein